MNLLRRYPLSSFVLLAIAISWAAAGAAQQVSPTAPYGTRFLLDTLAKFGPSLAGVVMMIVCRGGRETGRGLAAAMSPRVPIHWWLAALVGPWALWTVAVANWQLVGGESLAINSAALLTFIPLLLWRFFLGGGLGEEIGWRGFMLPRLLERRSPLVASLLVGLCWGVWHAPAFWGLADGKEGGAVMFVLFTVYTVALAVLFTLVWIRTGGSLMICCVLHASLNATENWVKAVLPAVGDDAAPTMIYAALILLVAIAAAVVLRRESAGEESVPACAAVAD